MLEFTGSVEERMSKNKKPYKVLVLNITEGYSKPVFLNDAEVELIALLND